MNHRYVYVSFFDLYPFFNQGLLHQSMNTLYLLKPYIFIISLATLLLYFFCLTVSFKLKVVAMRNKSAMIASEDIYVKKYTVKKNRQKGCLRSSVLKEFLGKTHLYKLVIYIDRAEGLWDLEVFEGVRDFSKNSFPVFLHPSLSNRILKKLSVWGPMPSPIRVDPSRHTKWPTIKFWPSEKAQEGLLSLSLEFGPMILRISTVGLQSCFRNSRKIKVPYFCSQSKRNPKLSKMRELPSQDKHF